ncbi:hypothetical protein RLOatenuis_2780 [Rickettsiales bacterium]|nr:hypothetical protein RLOatenuis_2780 [Rickettsiales bacterium]
MNKKILIIFLFLQMLFWYYAKDFKPNFAMLPDLPTINEIKLLSFGDYQAYFRIYALRLQNAGDSFGRFTALQDYDYNKLGKWLALLDELDHNSNFMPALASYYYSNTQRTEDVIYIVRYLEQHAEKNLEEKWWWMVQAVMLASTKLKNDGLALELAYKLAKFPNASYPIWAKNMPATILVNMGDTNLAEKLAMQISRDAENLSEQELNYMSYFLKQRLKQRKKKHGS